MPIPKLNGKGVLPPINGEPYSATTGTDEKRWVDGVLARKKGLGF